MPSLLTKIIEIPKIWHHKNYRQSDYMLLIAASSLLLAAIIFGLFSALYYAIIGSKSLAFYDFLEVLCNSVLLVFLLRFRNYQLIIVLMTLVSLVNLAFILNSLDGMQRVPTMVWLSLIPVVLSFTKSFYLTFLGLFCSILLAYFFWPFPGVLATENTPVYFEVDSIILTILLFGGTLSACVLFIMPMAEKSHQQSIDDHLTGLYNRHVLDKDLQFCFRDFKLFGKNFYVVFIDFDRFKEVNDLFGHESGDKILIELGGRLRKLSLLTDFKGCVDFYRFGGDEFVILVTGQYDNEKLLKLVREVKDELEKPYEFEQSSINISVSVGIAKSDHSTQSAQELIRFADYAMFENKHQNYLNYPPASNSEPGIRFFNKRILDIFRMIESKQFDHYFSVVFQPIYGAEGLEIRKLEALVRCYSTELGDVDPDDFITVAETTGMIGALFEWVLKKIILVIDARLMDFPDIVISVNLSPYQMGDSIHVAELMGIFNEIQHENRVSRLEFEVTETSPVTNNNYIEDSLKRIKEMGFPLVLDDYGQGHTSFLGLQKGVFKGIKLDKTLLWNMVNDEVQWKVFTSTINAAKSLDLSVTIEGIENQEQLNRVLELDCDFLQGFHLSKPVTGLELPGLLCSPWPGRM